MPCIKVKMPNGMGDVLVRAHGGLKACSKCGYLATRLCDFKLASRRTCDAPICVDCTTRLPGYKDACPRHASACLEACRRRGLEIPA